MSRSALQKSALHNKGRNELTYIGLGGPPPEVVAGLEESREVKSNELKLHGNQTTFNLNTLLANNIYQCDYFRALYQLRTYHEVIDEIYSKVTNVEPWATGTSRLPSTAFCLLFKFFTMRLTIKQIKGLVNHQDSPYIRCIGFLYLRYGCDPKELWEWVSPYIDDPEEFAPSSDPNIRMTLGEWLVKLLTELQYYGTMLPRIPVPIERKIKMRLVLHEEKRKRAAQNRRFLHAFREGARVKAIYEDAENDPAWYTAVISEVVPDEEDERGEDKYLVTFDGYGNQEVVTLGDLMLPPPPTSGKGEGSGDGGGGGARRSRSRSRDRSRSRSRGRGRRSRSRSRSHSRSRSGYGGGQEDSLLGKNLMEAVMKREREAVAAQGKDYAQRPQTYKGSLSLKQDRYTHRRKDSPTRMVPSSSAAAASSRARSRSRSRDRGRDRSRSRDRRERDRDRRSRSRDRDRDRDRKRGAEDSDKMKRLKEIYGDASGKRG